jgi:chaperonin GroEL (HSP60 family)
MGYDVDGAGVATCDAAEKGILDLFLVKQWAFKFAVNAATTVLKVRRTRIPDWAFTQSAEIC